MKYTCSMETVQQNGRSTLFSSKFHPNIYSILFSQNTPDYLIHNDLSFGGCRMYTIQWFLSTNTSETELELEPKHEIKP